MAEKPFLRADLAPYAKIATSMIRWLLLILTRAGVHFFSEVFVGFGGLRRWLNSTDGMVFLNVLTLGLILSGFAAIDAIRLYEPPVVERESVSPDVDITQPDPVLIALGNQRLKHSDIIEFAHQAGKLPASESLTVEEVFERGLVDEALDQLLLARAAEKEEEVMSNDEVITKLNISRNRILSAAYLQEVIKQGATEENAVRIYQSQRENFLFGDELRIRHIVVEEQSLAESIKGVLAEGADFRQVARDLSIAPAASSEGDLGYLAFQEMPKGYADRAYDLSQGQVSEPFESDQGWVLLRVEGRRPVKPPSYNDVKEEIFEFLKLQAIEQNLKELREESEIVLYTPDNPERDSEKPDVQIRE